MKWYAVAHGNKLNVIKASSPMEAAEKLFDCLDASKVTVVILSKNPNYLSLKKKREELEDLKERHRKKTGNRVL